MKTEKLTVRDIIRFYPRDNPKELAISKLLFNLVVPMSKEEYSKLIKVLRQMAGSRPSLPPNGVYKLMRAGAELSLAYLVLDVEDLKFLHEYFGVPPPGHGDMGYSAIFEASVIGWRPTPNEQLEMEVVKLTEKFAVLELQHRHKTVAVGSWPLSRLFGHNDYTPKGTFAVDAREKSRRVELGQRLKVVVSSYTVEEVGNTYRFRLNFSDVIPPWQDGTRRQRRAKAFAESQSGAT